MAQFMLFLRGGGSSTELATEEAEKLRAPYEQWAGKLHSEGKLVGADEIEERHYLVHRTNGHVSTDGPFAETREGIGGYFLIRVDTEVEALQIAQACPTLTRGGSVEVHRIIE